jgi:hypothetical protein
MNLELPTVLVTLGPEWATQVNEAFEVIDAHDHTSEKGVKVPTAGLNINSDLSFNSFKAVSLLSTQYNSQASPLSGVTNSNSLSVSNGNLYYTNGSGVSVQLTSGGSIVSSPATFNTIPIISVASNITISPSDTFVYLLVDTSAPRTINLPLASSVAGGRVYIIRDKDGNANINNITINAEVGDSIEGAPSYLVTSNNSSTWLIGDGAFNWYIS